MNSNCQSYSFIVLKFLYPEFYQFNLEERKAWGVSIHGGA